MNRKSKKPNKKKKDLSRNFRLNWENFANKSTKSWNDMTRNCLICSKRKSNTITVFRNSKYTAPAWHWPYLIKSNNHWGISNWNNRFKNKNKTWNSLTRTDHFWPVIRRNLRLKRSKRSKVLKRRDWASLSQRSKPLRKQFSRSIWPTSRREETLRTNYCSTTKSSVTWLSAWTLSSKWSRDTCHRQFKSTFPTSFLK